MKNKIKVSAVIAFVLFGAIGCSPATPKALNNTISGNLNSIESYKKTLNGKHAKYRNDAYDLIDRRVEVSFYKASVYSVMKSVAESLDLRYDGSFVPSLDYKVTVDFNGTLGEFIEEVYQQTGVLYRYRRNSLQVVNRDILEVSHANKICKLGEKHTVHISLKDSDPIDVFKYFSEQYGYSFQFDTKYYSLKNKEMKLLNDTRSTKLPIKKVSLFYDGCDEKEAFYSFLDSINFDAKDLGRERFLVKDYMFDNIEVPSYFSYEYTSGQTLGEGSGGSGGASVNVKSNGKKGFLLYLKNFLTESGKINISSMGYISVMDHPRSVKTIKRIIQTEIMKQAPMEMSLSIVRLEMSNDVSTGVNISTTLSNALGGGRTIDLATGDSGASDIASGFLFQATKEDGTAQVFNALQTIGNASVVREYKIKTRNGILSTFRAVDKIPYITTTTTSTTATTEANVEAKFADSGIIVNLLPQLSEHNEVVNLSTDILISEYLGDKVFNTAQGELKLPQISENEIQAPVRMNMGESIVLTGFNLRSSNINKSGIPGLIDMDLYNTERLFGKIGDESKASQLLIIISLNRIQEY